MRVTTCRYIGFLCSPSPLASHLTNPPPPTTRAQTEFNEPSAVIPCGWESVNNFKGLNMNSIVYENETRPPPPPTSCQSGRRRPLPPTSLCPLSTTIKAPHTEPFKYLFIRRWVTGDHYQRNCCIYHFTTRSDNPTTCPHPSRVILSMASKSRRPSIK